MDAFNSASSRSKASLMTCSNPSPKVPQDHLLLLDMAVQPNWPDCFRATTQRSELKMPAECWLVDWYILTTRHSCNHMCIFVPKVRSAAKLCIPPESPKWRITTVEVLKLQKSHWNCFQNTIGTWWQIPLLCYGFLRDLYGLLRDNYGICTGYQKVGFPDDYGILREEYGILRVFYGKNMGFARYPTFWHPDLVWFRKKPLRLHQKQEIMRLN